MANGTAYPKSYLESYLRGTLETDGFGVRHVVVRFDREGECSDFPDVLACSRAEARLRTCLGGAHGVKFLLKKGVPEPEGDPVHACVFSEEKGEAIHGRC